MEEWGRVDENLILWRGEGGMEGLCRKRMVHGGGSGKEGEESGGVKKNRGIREGMESLLKEIIRWGRKERCEGEVKR